MRKVGFWLAPALTLVAACSSEPEQPEQMAQTFHEVMTDEIDPGADVIWAVGNKAIGDQAGIDPSKMTDADWTKLAEGADALRTSALTIAAMDPIVLTRPGVPIGDEGAPLGHTSAEVQANFDRDPQTLRDMANALASHNLEIAAAARAHDAAKAGPLIDQLDSVCESCQLSFWYPEEKTFVEVFLREGNRQSEARP
jgi:hypothetical protein